ncbi:MAG: SH3 domain-containing protein [Lachnospiraceae bacterium]|nr:SH3 domain-containing protein [Lachnospiraceae bacterium]
MKKSTLNAIMQGVIIVLVIAIVFVTIKLIIRPDEVEVVEIPSESVSEVESVSESEPESEAELVIEQRVRMTSDNINVRSGPGTDYERLGSAYIGYDFEFVEQLEEWTKIVYDGKMAYVYSEYVEVIPMVLQEDGSYAEYVDLEESAAEGENASEDVSDNENADDASEEKED